MKPVFLQQCVAKRVPALAIAWLALALALALVMVMVMTLAMVRSVLSGTPHGIGLDQGQIAAHEPARPSLFFASPVAAGHARGE